MLKSTASIDNPVEIYVEQSILISYVRLARNLELPDVISNGESFNMVLYVRLDAGEVYDGLIYPFGMDVLLSAGEEEHVIGTLTHYIAKNSSPTDIEVECKASSIPPGKYTLFLRGYDYYHPDNISVLNGLDDSIVAEYEITVL